MDVQLTATAPNKISFPKVKGKETKKCGSDVGRSRVGDILHFAILTIKPDSTGQPSPAFRPHICLVLGLHSWHCLHHHTLSLQAALLKKSLVSTSSPCLREKRDQRHDIGNMLQLCKQTQLRQNQAGIYMPWSCSLSSSQPGTTPLFWTDMSSHCCRSSNSGICPSLPLEAGTQDHGSSLTLSPSAFSCHLRAANLDRRTPPFYEVRAKMRHLLDQFLMETNRNACLPHVEFLFQLTLL